MWRKGSSGFGDVSFVGVLRCAQDDGKCKGKSNGKCKCKCKGKGKDRSRSSAFGEG